MAPARVRDRRLRLPPTNDENYGAPRNPSTSRRRPPAGRRVNSLSEEQLTLLYNAPDAVAGALGAEAAALGDLAGKASEAFATKVVPALKEGGDALKPAVEQALVTGLLPSSDAFTALVETSRAAGWTDTELTGATTIALFLTVATIKKQATPPPPPPPTPAEKAASGAKKALSGALDLFEVVQGRDPTRPSNQSGGGRGQAQAVGGTISVEIHRPDVRWRGGFCFRQVTIYKTIDSTAKRLPRTPRPPRRVSRRPTRTRPPSPPNSSQQAQSALSKKAQETQKAAQEAAKRAAARGGPYAELLKERAANAAAKRAAALKDQALSQVSVVAERSAPAVQTQTRPTRPPRPP